LNGLREQARQRRVRWQIVACGSGTEAFADFCDALEDHPDALNLLLVDAETAVSGEPWEHLKKTEAGSMSTSAKLNDQYHLMVQTMEAWLLTDRENLANYYGSGFNAKSLPKTANVELVAKTQLSDALLAATKNTTKGPYHKTEHGFALLGSTDPAKARKSKHCDRLFTTIEKSLA